MAVTTLAILCAFQARIEAFAVLFLAQRLFAGALASGHIRGNTLEVVGLAIVDNASSFSYLVCVGDGVVATNAHAVLIACFSFSKALAVQLQAIYLGAFAASLRKMPGR